ncbi:unnamed protein product [Sphagnum jensenii]
MAVLGRLLISSAERLDLPDILSIDSYSAGDWRYFMDTLVGENTPYIIKGFDVVNPAQAIGTQSLSINIADSAMFYPGSGAGSLLLWTSGRQPERIAASPSVGDEFTEEVNTESVIQVQASVSTGAFPNNTVPVAIVVVGPSVITSIEDARPLMFRLGTGGIDPNPANRFAWPALPTSQYEQLETPITITSSSGPNPFQGGDKNLTSLKEWMDAIMTQIAALGGLQYWYEDITTFNLVNIFNMMNLTFYSKGKYEHSSSVPGQLTITENLVVKSLTSPQDVEGFWSSVNGGGTSTTAANAKSITLSAAYQGPSQTSIATYNQGTYTTGEIQIEPRSSSIISAAGGNFLWLALRSDTIQGIASISSVTVSGTLTMVDGTEASPAGASESANNGFEGGETVIIAGTTNYNGEVVIQTRSSTQFQFPLGAAYATETSGTATLARLDVRSEEGITKVVQGETIDIGEGDSDNIQRFIGMLSLAETHPNYFTGPYNTLWNLADYNSLPTDNLTLRASKLTAMMADKAQDKTLKYLCNASTAVNTTSGSAQQLTFSPASSTLTILQPGSPANSVVSLPSAGPGISLLVNQSAYVVINRNVASTPAIVVANTAQVPIDENVVVIASRLGDGSVWLWNGENVINATPLQPTSGGLVSVTYYDPVSLTLPTGTVVEDGITISAGSTVLFSALTSGTNNAVYMANGTGTTITGWTLQFIFDGNASPSSASTVIIQEGNSFKDQIGKFNDTTWVFNDKVRYFNGTDYFEQSSLLSSTLTDNTTNGIATSFNNAGSEYVIIDFSVNRGTARDTGTIYVTTDGVNAEVTSGGAFINNTGVIFTGSIVAGVFNLLYTTTSTGSNATMKFMIRRWSNGPGGPSGVPSYSGSSSSVVAAGPNESIQFNQGGLLDGSSNFLIDTRQWRNQPQWPKTKHTLCRHRCHRQYIFTPRPCSHIHQLPLMLSLNTLLFETVPLELEDCWLQMTGLSPQRAMIMLRPTLQASR